MTPPFKQLAPQDVLEAYYTNVQRSETIHMVMLNTNGVVTASNRATAQLFGKTPDDLVGMDWIASTTPEAEQAKAHSTFERLLATGLPDVSRDVLLLPNRKRLTMLWSHSLTHTDEKLSGILSFGIDITDYSHEHELLAKAEEIAGLGTYVLDVPTGTWTASAILERILGINSSCPHTVAGWLSLIHPDEVATMSDYFNSHVLIQHKNFDKSYRIIRKSDGAVRLVQGYGKLEFGADGGVSHMLGTIQDITEQRAAEELFSLSAKQTGQVIYDWNIAAKSQTHWEGAIEEVTGYPPAEYRAITNDEWYDHIHPDDRVGTLKRLEDSRRAGSGYRYEYRFRRKDGSYIMVEDSGAFIKNNAGESIRMVGAIKDISLRLKFENTVRESEQRMRAILDKTPDDIVTITPDGTCTYANDSGIFGYTPSEMVGSNQLRLVHPEDRALVTEALRDLQTTPNKTLKIKIRLHHKNGTWRNVESIGTNLLHEPTIRGFLIFTRDITDLKKGEEAMIRVDELEAMNRAMVGRELRIAELKAELEQLKTKLAQPQK